MKGLRNAAVLAAMVGASAIATSAQAAQYLVTFTSVPFEGTTPHAFSGTLTTTDVADANGYYQVTSIDGTRNGEAVTLLAPGSNDNLFRPDTDYVTENGIGFTTASGFGYVYSYDGFYLEDSEAGYNFVDSFTAAPVPAATPVAAAVPEPATWGMMILGMGMMGGVLRRRVRASEVKFNAQIKRIAGGEVA